MPDQIPTGHDGADERLVLQYLKQLRAGRPITMPLVVRLGDGRYSGVDEHDVAKLEAARRHGHDAVRACVIDDPGPEKLRQLRRARAAARLSHN